MTRRERDAWPAPVTNWRYLTTQYSPVLLLNNGLTDTSGNGNNFVDGGGTRRSCIVAPGLQGIYFDGAYAATKTPGNEGVRLVDAGTWEAIVRFDDAAAHHQLILMCPALGEATTDNYLFQFRTIAGAVARPESFWEYGAGNNVDYVAEVGVPVGRPFHYAMTRSAASGTTCTVKWYVDGILIATAAGLHIAEKAGSGNIQYLRLGGADDATLYSKMGLASIKMVAAELSAAAILAEANYARGLALASWPAS